MKKGAVALTGGIACGKSEVAAMLKEQGVPVIDTDAMAHELLTPGHWVFEKVVEAFGPGMLTVEGFIDRRRLGGLVFADAAAREQLNGIMHPVIYGQVFAWLDLQLPRVLQAVAMIPLLYETGMDGRFDRVLVVAADEDLMIRRMIARGWTEAEARARMAAQWPLAEKVRRAHAVIWNNEDLPALNRATLKAWENITEEKETEI